MLWIRVLFHDTTYCIYTVQAAAAAAACSSGGGTSLNTEQGEGEYKYRTAVPGLIFRTWK